MKKMFMGRISALRSDASLREVVRGASTSLLIQTAGALLGLSVSLVIARMLGAEGTGIYYLAMSIVAIASTVGRVGLDNTVVRQVASLAAVGDWTSVAAVNKAAVKVSALASCIVAAGILLSASSLSAAIFHKEFMRVPIMVSALAVVPFSVSMVQAESLRGLKDLRLSQLVKNVLVAMGTLATIYPAALLLNAEGAVLAYTFSVAAAGVTSWLLWRRAYKAKSCAATTEPAGHALLMRLMTDSLPLFGVSLSNLVILYGATVMLGMWGGIGDVGIFNAANRVASLFLFPLFGMINILTPNFAEMHQRGDVDGMARLARQSSAILMLLTLPAAVAVFFGAGRILALFGPQFVAGAAMLRMLLVGVYVNVSTGAVAELLMMTGHGKVVNRIIAVNAAAMIVQSAVLLPHYGGVGAATALSASYILINILMVLGVKRALGFWPIPLIGRRSDT